MNKYTIRTLSYSVIAYSPLKNLGCYPEDESEIFIKNIPPTTTINDLITFFEKIATIYEIKLMMLPNGVKNRRFGFVTYWSKDTALRATKTLGDIEFKPGVTLSLEKSFNNRRIFLGNVVAHKTKDELWMHLIGLGHENIVDVIMYRAYNERTANRGYAFIEFKSHEEAARFRITAAKSLKLWGRKIIVDWAVPYPEPNNEIMKNVTKIFLRNLNVLSTKADLIGLLSNITNVHTLEKVYKFKNYAFIHLGTRSEAEDLYELLQDYFKNTNIEVSWAKPQQYFTTPAYRQSKLIKNKEKYQNKFNIFEPKPSGCSQSSQTDDEQTMLYLGSLLNDL